MNSKSLKALIAALLLSFLPITKSYAVDVYYIELGNARTEEEAQLKWQELLDQHTILLEKLQYFPRTLIHAGRKQRTHIQAGPIEEKHEAQKLCNKLFAVDVSCFIAEGLPPGYERKRKQEKAPVAEPLPWLKEPVQQAQIIEDKPESEGLIDWVFGSSEAVREEDQETTMQVAEAIRVPLSESAEPIETKPLLEKPVISGKSGWLNVASFSDQKHATIFWKQIRTHTPSLAAGLRVLVIAPMEKRGSEVLLNIGPFASETGAVDFCEQAVKTLDVSYVCRFERTDAKGKKASRSEMGRRSDSYNRRRKNVRNLDYNNLGSVRAQAYWLQVASEPTQLKAAAEWKEILRQHGDIVKGMRNSISRSLDGDDYIVRLGPISTSEEATSICYSLKERGAYCQIFGGL